MFYNSYSISTFIIAFLFGLAFVWFLSSFINRWFVNWLIAAALFFLLMYLWFCGYPYFLDTLRYRLSVIISWEPSAFWGFIMGMIFGCYLRWLTRERRSNNWLRRILYRNRR